MQAAADRVVVLGASAGGPLALGDLLSALPDDLDAAVVVVLHLLADHRSMLAQVLGRRTSLPVVEARGGHVLEAGRVYVAPPNAHLAFDAGDRSVRLETTPPVRFHRPSIDRTFESAADAFASGTIAVVLTGTGSDGSRGALHVHEQGGVVLAQEGSEFTSMPNAAIETGIVDRILPLRALAPAIVELTRAVA